MAISDLKNLSKDDILDALGLETKHTMGDHLLSGLLMFGVGVAVGVGIGMLLAPKAGSELRDDLTRGFQKTVDMANDTIKKEAGGRSTTSSSSGAYSHNPV